MRESRLLLVLVHSPLVGPRTWHGVADLLRSAGHIPVVPSLLGAFGGAGPYYPALVDRVAAEVNQKVAPAEASERDGAGIVLIGHSGAGALLPAIADAAGPVSAALFVDAILPHPGRTWFDTAPAELAAGLRGMARHGRLPPWLEWFPPATVNSLLPDPRVRAALAAELPRLPLAYFDEPAPRSMSWPPRHVGYLRLSEGYQGEADRAAALGWPVEVAELDHLAPVTRPGEVTEAILRLLPPC